VDIEAFVAARNHGAEKMNHEVNMSYHVEAKEQ
jgi:hypothetical protein